MCANSFTMKFALMLVAAATICLLPSLDGRVRHETVLKEGPTMLSCPGPGKNNLGCFGYGYLDGIAPGGTVYKCSTCGHRWISK